MADNDSGRKVPDNNNPNNNDNKKSNLLTLFLVIVIALCGFGLVSNMGSSDKSKEITYDKFINYVKEVILCLLTIFGNTLLI